MKIVSWCRFDVIDARQTKKSFSGERDKNILEIYQI